MKRKQATQVFACTSFGLFALQTEIRRLSVCWQRGVSTRYIGIYWKIFPPRGRNINPTEFHLGEKYEKGNQKKKENLKVKGRINVMTQGKLK
jgi:hypothetical protein